MIVGYEYTLENLVERYPEETKELKDHISNLDVPYYISTDYYKIEMLVKDAVLKINPSLLCQFFDKGKVCIGLKVNSTFDKNTAKCDIEYMYELSNVVKDMLKETYGGKFLMRYVG